ncbi:hypothetical protein B0H14DRAFT_2581209 [Mycena olivaceomarginata]|nr:hypothetical protein B0H14DRAFT_2581209 [Mycena olivaceomarginata]
MAAHDPRSYSSSRKYGPSECQAHGIDSGTGTSIRQTRGATQALHWVGVSTLTAYLPQSGTIALYGSTAYPDRPSTPWSLFMSCAHPLRIPGGRLRPHHTDHTDHTDHHGRSIERSTRPAPALLPTPRKTRLLAASRNRLNSLRARRQHPPLASTRQLPQKHHWLRGGRTCSEQETKRVGREKDTCDEERTKRRGEWGKRSGKRKWEPRTNAGDKYAPPALLRRAVLRPREAGRTVGGASLISPQCTSVSPVSPVHSARTLLAPRSLALAYTEDARRPPPIFRTKPIRGASIVREPTLAETSNTSPVPLSSGCAPPSRLFERHRIGDALWRPVEGGALCLMRQARDEEQRPGSSQKDRLSPRVHTASRHASRRVPSARPSDLRPPQTPPFIVSHWQHRESDVEWISGLGQWMETCVAWVRSEDIESASQRELGCHRKTYGRLRNMAVCSKKKTNFGSSADVTLMISIP